jgi:eukaryotic-like serine/threonine-protein kinase
LSEFDGRRVLRNCNRIERLGQQPVKGIDVEKLSSDLLVVVLAILTDTVPQSVAADVVKSWTERSGRSLVEWFKEKTRLDDARMRALECLATTHLKAHQNDVRVSLSAWNALDLTQAVVTEIGDEALKTTLGASLAGDKTLPLDGTGLDRSQSSFAQSDPANKSRERFKLIRQHARGGIGQVWLARDGELQRDVAVKEIQPRYAESEGQRARFVLEAEITGNLEHPGIVPVYSLGRNADGRPYYAMRFIEGESLSSAIRQFHHIAAAENASAETRKHPGWGIEFRLLLRRFLDVCDAIDFAHSRKVLHRDLKPANIMLGRYGETLVVDWGLAKVIGKSDVFPPDDDGHLEPDLGGGSLTSSGHTEQGTTIGTPSYMSPEQARGEIDRLGPPSDVYSLGATLYEFLTGRAPFPGKNIAQVLAKVLKGDFPAPRTLDRTIPAPLESVCLKAMALEPEARYQSVHDMAQDLEHWLADEPVAAYSERPLERLGRWLRQHRTLTYAAATALLGATFVATAAAVVIDGGRRRETAARKEAESNFDMAQQAVDDYLTQVSENTLLKEQDSVDIRGLRRELLENALRYYKRFVSQRSEDPLLRRRLATAYFRVGQITSDIGSAQDAIAAYRSSQEIWQKEAEADPRDDDLKSRLADCHLAIGVRQGALGDLQNAMASFRQARSILEGVTRRQPSSETDQSRLANCYTEIAIVQGSLESEDRGLEMLEKAKAIQEQLVAQKPGDFARRERLAEMINSLGFVYYKRGDTTAEARSFQQVQEVSLSLLDEIGDGPKPVKVLSLLAITHFNLAAIEHANGEKEKALQSLEKSLEYRLALVDSHPSVSGFRESLADTYRDVAIEEQHAGQKKIAMENLQKAVDVFEKLIRSEPEQARYHAGLGRTLNAIGWIHDEIRENRLAIPEFERAVKEQQNAIARSPHDNEYKEFLSNHLENLGEQYLDLGDVARAWPYYNQALVISRKLNGDHPENTKYANALAAALLRLGSIKRHSGDAAAALEWFAEGRQVTEQFLKTAPDNSLIRYQLAEALTCEAWAQFDLNNTDDALKSLQQAAATIKSTREPSTRGSRACLTEALQARAWILRSVHQDTAADNVDAERLALWEGQPVDELANLAITQTGRAALVGYGTAPAVGQGLRARDIDLDLAAANLTLAIARGFTDLVTIRSKLEAPLLLDRGDIKLLIERLESRESAPPGQSPK